MEKFKKLIIPPLPNDEDKALMDFQSKQCCDRSHKCNLCKGVECKDCLFYIVNFNEFKEWHKKYNETENGNYYDYNGMGEDKPPTAPKANKKEFTKEELKF